MTTRLLESAPVQAAPVDAPVCPDCSTALHRDGECRECAAGIDPARVAYLAAIYAGDLAEHEGRPYPVVDARRDEATMRRYEVAQILAEIDAATPANGCWICGRERRSHGIQPHPPYRLGDRHAFDMPPDWLRLLRIRARRALADGRLYLAVRARFDRFGGAAR